MTVGMGSEDQFHEVLHIPSAFHELHRKPVEELGVGRPLALVSEVLQVPRKSGAEEESPYAVDKGAGGQGIIRGSNPAGEIKAGEVILVEDLIGKGHLSQSVGGQLRHSLFIPVE